MAEPPPTSLVAATVMPAIGARVPCSRIWPWMVLPRFKARGCGSATVAPAATTIALASPTLQPPMQATAGQAAWRWVVALLTKREPKIR